eukprot:1159327-Pelagomonas_calceolata.AAC.6
MTGLKYNVVHARPSQHAAVATDSQLARLQLMPLPQPANKAKDCQSKTGRTHQRFMAAYAEPSRYQAFANPGSTARDLRASSNASCARPVTDMQKQSDQSKWPVTETIRKMEVISSGPGAWKGK